MSIHPALVAAFMARNLIPIDYDFTAMSALPARVTFARASTATRVNASGVLESVASGAPRFDFDPLTLAPKGLLIEEQRTNQLLRSAEFDNASWAKAGSGGSPPVAVIVDAALAPDGTTTADKLCAGTSPGTHVLQQTVAAYTAGVFSIYLKAAEISSIRLSLFNDAVIATFDAATGTSSGSGTRTMTPVGNGWYRCELQATGISNTVIRIYTADNLAGNGSDGVLIWGAQFEAAASFATSYIPTTAAAATRAADNASMTGANFSKWFNPVEGTLLIEASKFAPAGYSTALIVRNTATATADRLPDLGMGQGISGGGPPGTFRCDIFSSSVAQANLGSNIAFVKNQVERLAFAYKANDFATSHDGAAVVTDASGSLPVGLNTLELGNRSNGTFLNGHIRRLKFYRRRLSNAELQALTA